jgi:biotin carboxylase
VNDALLIIGGRPQALAKAKELGLRVVWLQQKKPLAPGQADPADAVIMMNYRDWDKALPMVRAAHRTFGFTRVVSLVDQAMELVGRINDEFGLPGTSRAVAHRFNDKLAMRAWLRETGFEDVAAEPAGDADGLRRFGARHGYPFVLKPTDGTASRGVLRIQGPEDVDPAWRSATQLRGRADLPFAAYYPVRDFLAEEYLDGTEYSVEAFSFDGRHSVIAVTGKSQDGVIETGHAQPAMLSAEDEAVIAAHVAGFLDAMGLRDGVSHTELRMTARGPRIVEGHNRVAGGRVMDLVEAVYGIDLERYTVGWPFRLVPELPRRPEARGAGAIRFLTAEPGTVEAIEGADEVRAHPGVLDLELDVTAGDVVPEVTDNFCRPGQVLVTAADTEAAAGLAETLARKVHIVTRRPATGDG